MDQLLILLRARCEFCGYLRLAPVNISRFTCKLNLVHHGLIEEAQEVDDILSTPKSSSSRMTNGVDVHEDPSDEGESEGDDISEKLNGFVRHAIKKANRMDGQEISITRKVGAIAEQRRLLIKDFLSTIAKTKACGRCKGYINLPNGDCKFAHSEIAGFRAGFAKIGTARYFGSHGTERTKPRMCRWDSSPPIL